MKKSIRILLLCCCSALCLTLLAVSAFAVPAAPNSGREGADAACRSHTNALVTLDDIPAARRSLVGRKAYVPVLGHVKKNIPMVAIVVGFSNIGYSNDYNWNDTFFSNDKSITSYYSDMSFGKFTFMPANETSAYRSGNNTNRADKANDGVIHINLPVRHEDWATNYAQTNPKKDKEQYRQLTEVFKAAIEAASQYINFASYDADRNGTIENTELAIGFVMAGYEGAYLESFEQVGADKVLWAHAYTITDLIADYDFNIDPPTPGGVVVSDYIAVAEELEPGMPQPISTLAHELGHYLGLPDLYDTNYATNHWSDYDVNTASIMCSAWGPDPETGSFSPFSMDPWCRYKLGWIDPVIAKDTGDYAVVSQSYTKKDAYSVVLIPTQKSKEYYLVENRQLTKWDEGICMDDYYMFASLKGGIMLWHIDDAVFEQYCDDNMVNNSFHRPAIMPLFPEETRDGKTTFIGVGEVDYYSPFYDRTYAIDILGLTDATINLPVYGTGGMADQRMGRWESGITVEFLNDTASNMRIRVNTDNQKQISGEDECMYCHKTHSGPLGGLVAFFHRILYFFRALFKR